MFTSMSRNHLFSPQTSYDPLLTQMIDREDRCKITADEIAWDQSSSPSSSMEFDEGSIYLNEASDLESAGDSTSDLFPLIHPICCGTTSIESNSDHHSVSNNSTDTWGDDSELPTSDLESNSSDFDSNDSLFSESPAAKFSRTVFDESNRYKSLSGKSYLKVTPGQNHDRRKQNSFERRVHVGGVNSYYRQPDLGPQRIHDTCVKQVACKSKGAGTSCSRPFRNRRRPPRFSGYSNDFLGSGAFLADELSTNLDRQARLGQLKGNVNGKFVWNPCHHDASHEFSSASSDHESTKSSEWKRMKAPMLKRTTIGSACGRIPVRQSAALFATSRAPPQQSNLASWAYPRLSQQHDSSREPAHNKPLAQQQSPPINRRRHLLHFIVELLNRKQGCVEWIDRGERIFQITNPDHLTKLWGQYKKNLKMTFESLSRSLRLYYAPKKLERIQGKRHQYRLLHFPTRAKSRGSASLNRRMRDGLAARSGISLPSASIVSPDKSSMQHGYLFNVNHPTKSNNAASSAFSLGGGGGRNSGGGAGFRMWS